MKIPDYAKRQNERYDIEGGISCAESYQNGGYVKSERLEWIPLFGHRCTL
jgi:hypothetical protein